ncbi:MAG TPA: maltose alpha-D-glucosyltransferase [Anaerolineae bacterium]|nr:maltose alpha-D-glucosyltransferase [Anaerolineae bacterium]
MSTLWYKEAVFYELYIRGFKDSNGDGHGDLPGLIEKLDYVQSLGVDCIWILPHYPSPLKDDGYDVADYYGVHPDYGTIADFKAFVEAAHERGLKVVVDMVMNHTSDQHPWFQAARADRESPYRNYYVWSDTGEEYADIRIVFPDFEESNWTYDEVAGQYYWHRFFRSQPDLNYDYEPLQEEMLKVVRYWLDLGVDGFRLDAIIYLYEREGTDGAGLPETHAFIKKLRRMMDADYPGRILIAEANDWPERLMDYFGDDDECHMCFHFPLMPRLYLALLEGDKTPIVDIIDRTPAPPAKAQWLSFLRNHDELSLEMVTEEEAEALYSAYAPAPRMKINNGIRRRLAPILNRDWRRYRLLLGLLMSLPGTPILYYGDEIGMGDNIDLPDRHGVRTPMQWEGEHGAGFSTSDETYQPLNREYPRVNVKKQQWEPHSFLNLTRSLVRARQTSAALRRGDLVWVSTGDPALLAFERQEATQTVLCLFNLTDSVRPLPLNLTGYKDMLGYAIADSSVSPLAMYWLVPESGE